MKKLIFSVLVFTFCISQAWSQRIINETYDMKAFKTLDLQFEYPQLVKIKVWDKEEVKIEGTVDIQAGQFDDDFQLKTRKSGDRFKIESHISNLDKHRNSVIFYSDDDDDDDEDDDNDDDRNTRTLVSSNNGTTIYNNSDKDGRSRYKNGVAIDIELTITVPQSMKVELDARYGLVEIFGTPQSLEVEARYGGVDVTVNESSSLELDARTQWGQIYTNLKVPVKMGGDDMTGKWMKAHLALQQGKNSLNVVSQYGNVYLRKN